MLSAEAKKYLKSIYYDSKHPAGYSGVDRLYSFVKQDGKFDLSRKDVEQFLHSSEIYSTHVQKNQAKHWYSVVSPYPGYMVDVDSMYFDLNDKRYKTKVIVAVDVFSRKAAARAVSNLKAATVKKALGSILDELGPVERVRMDRGSEYKNDLLMKELKRRKVSYHFSYPRYKSNYAEIFIRYLKEKMYKAAQYKGQANWQKILPGVIQAYNSRVHRSLGMAPNQVSQQNTADLWFKFKRKRLAQMPPSKPYKYDVNDRVRVNYNRVAFRKGFLEQNSTIVYYVTSRYSRAHINRYTLKDQQNVEQPGSFTENQLTRTFVDDNTEYRIEKIIHYRKIRNVRHALIKWLHFPAKYNSYVPEADVVNLRNRK